MVDGTVAFYDVHMFWIFVALLMVWLLVAAYRTLRRPTIVIGAEQAAAQAREDERLARGDAAPSPLADVEYGDALLIAPKQSAADERIRELAAQYANADAKTREAMRYSLSGDDQYKLFTFAQRAAVFGMRERWWIESALQAMAMLDVERMDYRDIPMALARIHHAARRAGVDAPQAFADAVKLASPQAGQAIAQFIAKNPPDKDLRKNWGFDEYEGGFLSRGISRYRPTHDLATMAVRIAEVIGRDRYEVTSVSVAEELPPVWFAPQEEQAKPIVKSAHAGADVHADLREDREQSLMIFLIELPGDREAQQLLDLARPASAKRDYALLGVAHASLFCLFVQRGEMLGVDAVETDETLQRFAEPVRRILAA